MQKSAVKMVSPADMLSFVNALFGFLSIVSAIYGEIWLSVTFVLLALLSDGLDGIIARKLRSGCLGENMDSLADIISFFAAPSVMLMAVNEYRHPLILFSLSTYLLATLLRLSSFPLFKSENYFEGLPLPAAGIVLVMLMILNVDFMMISVAIIFLSILMVSKIRYPKVDKRMGLVALILSVAIMVLRDALYSIAPLSMLIILFIYIVFGPAYLNRL